jgi:hypothetical protein
MGSNHGLTATGNSTQLRGLEAFLVSGCMYQKKRTLHMVRTAVREAIMENKGVEIDGDYEGAQEMPRRTGQFPSILAAGKWAMAQYCLKIEII